MRPIDGEHLKRWILARWEETDPTSEYPLRAIEIINQIDRENVYLNINKAVKDAYKHGKSKGIKKGRAMAKAQIPCDACRFNPPSSANGKPCTMCPAEPSHAEEVKKDEAMAQRWRLVAKQPPKEEEEVFVYLFDPPSPYIAWVKDGKWQTEDFTLDEEDNPIAYMLLPEPYKGEQNG
ncbi:MAG: hypothetical protein IKH75_14190 [Ruminococcus sp.]|nr:hypothetical protein [Ruminococcus sp.]